MSIKELMDFNFWEMIIRTTLAFAALLILARILGKKQLSQLTFFHYITGIAFGSIAAEMAGQVDVPFVDGLIALIWWAVLTLLMSYLSLKSAKFRVIVDDEPSIIIKDGVIMEKAMKKMRLHVDDLLMLLREQSIFSIQDVHYAVMETNGELSVMKKVAQQGATKQDVQAPVTLPKYMPSEVISDGKFVQKNLVELKITEEWVLKKLRKKGIDSVEKVFYAQIQTDRSLFTDLKRGQLIFYFMRNSVYKCIMKRGGFMMKEITSTEVQELLNKGEQLNLVDVREADEVAEGIIPGAIHIPLGDVAARISEFDKSKAYVADLPIGTAVVDAQQSS